MSNRIALVVFAVAAIFVVIVHHLLIDATVSHYSSMELFGHMMMEFSLSILSVFALLRAMFATDEQLAAVQ